MLDMTVLGYSPQSLGVIHNDINGLNIILTGNSEMVLIDFGSARSTSDSEPGRAGPKHYLDRQHARLLDLLVEHSGVFPGTKWVREAISESEANPDQWGKLGEVEDWRNFLKELPLEGWEWDERERLEIPQIGPFPYASDED
jgi:serine/threonine protein kinase